MRAVLLIDNGSKRPAATLNLRRLAAALSEHASEPVHPVSLLHSDRIPAEQLGGRPAETLTPTLERLLDRGCRDIVLVPLFFGPSRALTGFVPDTAATLAEAKGPFALRIAPELCPLPEGEPRLVRILLDNLQAGADAADLAPRRVVLVDHGSPIRVVTAVRNWLAERLSGELDEAVELEEAVMERRAGGEYDFNGPLLEDLLDRLATADAQTPILLSMLFLSAGRHAGPGGDIAEICERVCARHPGLRVLSTPLVGDHPGLIDILASRLAEAERIPALSRASG